MEAIILVLLVGALELLAFFIGARIGQKASKDEEIKLPNINPVEAYRKHEERAREKQEQREVNIMLENIDNYDGSGLGQKDVK